MRLHDWAPGLPPNATFFKGEVPRSRNHLPRFVDEFVMGQIDREPTLLRLPDLTTQTAVVILIETGLRSIDTLRLPFDPITVDEAGAPYLIFYNHKLSRDAVIPISQRLVAQIRRQQHDLDKRFGSPRPPYIQGEVIHLAPGGPLSDAAWALENLARAKQTLPNGYCGLPLQQTCPHPNACLTCDNFLTTVEFLPAHHEQLQRTEQLIASAQESGAQRLVEINEPVRVNLIRIIEGLDALPGAGPTDA